MGNQRRLKHTTEAARRRPRDPRQTLAECLKRSRFYGAPIGDDFVRTAVSIFRADKGGRDFKQALTGSLLNVAKHMDAVSRVLGTFQQTVQSQDFVRMLKELRPLLQSTLFPLVLRRYDLPTLWADLPTLMKTFSGLLAGGCDFVEMLPSTDKKLVRNRALAWLYVAVRHWASTDAEVHAALASVIYLEDQDLQASGDRKIYDHIRLFQKYHFKEYRQIEQYLEDRPCPTGNELFVFAFLGTPVPPNNSQ